MEQDQLLGVPNVTPAPPGAITEIPLQIDPIPYKQMGAQGRYPQQVIPDTIPPFYAVLGATDKDFNGDMLSTDGQRNLNVHVASGGGGGNSSVAMLAFGNSTLNVLALQDNAAGPIAPNPKLIYGMTATATYTNLPPAGSTGDSVMFTLTSDVSAGAHYSFGLVALSLEYFTGGGGTTPAANGSVTFPFPIDLSAYWPGYTKLYVDVFNNNNFPVKVSYILWYT